MEDFVGTSLWETVPVKHLFGYRKEHNTGMKESHRLALTMGGVIDRSLDDTDGLQSSDYGTYQIFEKGDLAFKLIDLQNIKTSRVGLVPRRGIMSSAYIRLSPRISSVLSEFYYWYFYGAYLGNIFNGLGGGIRQNLSQSELLEFPVPDISYEEQTAIANFLDRETARIDGLIEKKGRFIELLKEKRAAVITHAVTKGIDADVPMKDSGVEWIGQVPSHWDVRRIAALFREAFRAPDPSLPVLSVSIHDGVTDGELSDEERDRKVALSEDRTKYQGVAPGDLVYNMMRAWQGAFGAVQVDGLVSPAYVVAHPIAEFRTKFIEHLLHTKSASEEIRRFSRGIADFRMRLYWDHFRNLRVCLPSLEEQDEILAYIDRETARIDGLISTTDRSIELLKEKRSALITAAVTGKIDVRSAA
ncbi:restriction endonuclease subunit S [Celeribacter sp.]|uniref:restriction endonuclease subunit S n=1 Tax=Celeribacter sp. TaxID=1890673 RepID=UPI003A8DAFC5